MIRDARKGASGAENVGLDQGGGREGWRQSKRRRKMESAGLWVTVDYMDCSAERV